MGTGEKIDLMILVKKKNLGMEKLIKVLKNNELPKGVVVEEKYISIKFPESTRI